MEAKDIDDLLKNDVQDIGDAYTLLENLLKSEDQDAHYQVRTIIGRRWIAANEGTAFVGEVDKYSSYLAAINRLIMDKDSGRYF
jgi:hypothetical protein